MEYMFVVDELVFDLGTTLEDMMGDLANSDQGFLLEER